MRRNEINYSSSVVTDILCNDCFSKGQLHVTDYSNASSTGMFDPFVVSDNYIVFGH